ncbi:hypothetical protein Vadar_034238 [Vaccinium darrowii]|uniref:Uncharacterized protein n=1 Tax=Vaccinium darrowii TaxID=229202 RepID=A0ACB7Z0S0_9ERIC|nr:hypothetical protein Vadar_034238 [Vaccinium darrowii]
MQNLQRKTKYLSAQENDMNKQISCAKFRPLKRRKSEVKVWLRDVRVLKDDVQRLKDDVQRLKDDVQRFEQEVFGERNFFSHVRLGERIIKTIQEVEELHKKGKAFNGLVVEEIPSGRLLMPPTKDFVESTEARNLERVWECLMNGEDRWIGVSGMGGVGKTTIMKHIHNRLLEEIDKVDSVFWLTVSNSKPFNVIRLQKDMAKALKLNLSDNKNETKSASELYYLLSQRKKYVLILDDVWETFHLERVGIPEPTKSNGCKLVLTTRSLEVCRKMECRIVKVRLLTEQEALELFMRKGIGRDMVLGAKDTEIATEIAKRCAHLPLAIVTIATSMRGLNCTREWKNALNEFTNLMDEVSGGESEVFEQLKFSYSRLGDKAVQDCFLYCSLYPEDFEIFVEELIELWIAEGLIREMNSVQAMVDKCHSILEKLKSTCLLEATIVDGSERVRMHDLIRDMAFRITGGRYRYVEKDEEGLWFEDHEKISFMFKNVCPKRPLVCPRLTSLLLGWNDSI